MQNFPPLKRCTKCGDLKEKSLFSKQKKGAEGLRSWCKECNYKAVKNIKRRRLAEMVSAYSNGSDEE